MKHSDKLSLRNAAAGKSARTAASKPAKTKPRSARAPTQPGRLVELNGFGDDPGKLRMLAHLSQAAAGRPLPVTAVNQQRHAPIGQLSQPKGRAGISRLMKA